jgi:fumarylacetoacetate (FAA) hydrolase family protein
VSLSLVSVYEGQPVKALPSSVLLTVSGVEVASRKLEPEPDLILLIEGKREIISAKWGNDVINNRAEADLHLPYAAIAKLASAQRVEGQAGMTKFFLTVENLTAMRDFLSRLKPEHKIP